jgi:hypothetical protein
MGGVGEGEGPGLVKLDSSTAGMVSGGGSEVARAEGKG